MKQLATEFLKGFDGLPKQRFKQVVREGKSTIYERRRLNGTLVGYEAFVPRVAPKALSQRGKWYEEREVYPNANDFGKTAWFCMTFERAKERLGL